MGNTSRDIIHYFFTVTSEDPVYMNNIVFSVTCKFSSALKSCVSFLFFYTSYHPIPT